MPEETAKPSQSVALASATIGVVTGLASGALGYSHAKSLYEAAKGTSAGLEDYITVGQAFWDGLPIAVAVALVVGFVTYGSWSPGLPYLAVAVGAGVLAYAASVDPQHLLAYQRTISSGATSPSGLMGVWFATYGALAGWCALIAGIGVGHAGGLLAKTP